MLRAGLVLAVAALAASSGCSLCQNCDDYSGSYYGGRVGDWTGYEGRAGSVYAPTAYAPAEDYKAEGYASVSEPAE